LEGADVIFGGRLTPLLLNRFVGILRGVGGVGDLGTSALRASVGLFGPLGQRSVFCFSGKGWTWPKIFGRMGGCLFATKWVDDVDTDFIEMG
jgi:hypothetical protein